MVGRACATQRGLEAPPNLIVIELLIGFRMRKPRHWEPRPFEAHLFHEIYIDETSQTGHKFLILGGIVIPRRLSAQFEADIIEARHPRLSSLDSKGRLREIGWSEISNGDFESYKKIVDAYFSFAFRRLQGSGDACRFYCSVVNTQVPGRRYTGKRGQVGFNREIFYHCLSIARRHRRYLFHVYPDDRSTTESTTRLCLILNRGWAKTGYNKDWTFRRLKFRLSHEFQALQISDIFIGAIAYRLNRHYDSPSANADKKKLCDYILKRGALDKFIRETSFKEKAKGEFIMWFRRHKN